MVSEEILYSIALRNCPLIGDINFRKLVSEFGSASEVWHLSKKELKKISGVGDKTAFEIGEPQHLRFAEEEIKLCEAHGIKIKLRHLGELPKLLSDCVDAPAIIYQKGDLDHEKKSISMVGTRNVTPYGRDFVKSFLDETPSPKVHTVSGLALGVDTVVHEESLKNKIPTIAVLAHGFHTLYPSKNRKLSEKILENGGALITEFSFFQRPDREHFIQRNRIVAGLSSALIVVETAYAGGSISTATFANSYNRDVFALPGKITDKYSQGCNHLIYKNKAATISNIKELYQALGISEEQKMESLFTNEDLGVKLTDNQQIIYQLIKDNPNADLDFISEKSGFSSYKILPILLELEILGCIRSFSGRQFSVL